MGKHKETVINKKELTPSEKIFLQINCDGLESVENQKTHINS